jgi:hypothetical protein
MTASAVYQSAFVPNHDPDTITIYTLTAYKSGDLALLSNGRAGYCLGLNPSQAASQYNAVSFAMRGNGDAASASATTFAAGARVFWNPTTLLAVATLAAAGDGGFYLGMARTAKIATQLVVNVDLNAGNDCADLLYNAGAPTSGATGTGYNYANIGALLVDTTNGILYQNRGTKASPGWAAVGLETT